MVTGSALPSLGLRRLGLEKLHANWGWFVGLGAALVILGTIGIGASVLVTMTTMLFVGYLMMFSGVLEVVHSFAHRAWGGFFIDLLTGILYVVVGLFVVAHPLATGVALTLLIAMFLIFEGIFRMGIALTTRFHNWGWVLLNGLIDVALGFMIWARWPNDSLWVIGLFVCIDLLMNGWSLIMLGLTAKNLPAEPAAV